MASFKRGRKIHLVFISTAYACCGHKNKQFSVHGEGEEPKGSISSKRKKILILGGFNDLLYNYFLTYVKPDFFFKEYLPVENYLDK